MVTFNLKIISIKDVFTSNLTFINEAIRNNKFPDSLKIYDVKPVYKKLDSSDKDSHRPVSVLPLLSKVFENVFCDQLYDYVEKSLGE